MFDYLWTYKVQLAPLILAYLVYEVPGMIRKIFHFHYVPIYIALFPLNELNPLLAEYYDEREDRSCPLDEKGLKEIEKSVKLRCMMALMFGAIVLPLISGFFSAFFLPTDHLLPLFVLISIFKLRGIIESIWHFKDSSAANLKSTFLLLSTYIFYFALSFHALRSSFHWTKSYIDKSDYLGLADQTAALILGHFVGIFVVAFLGNFFSDALLNKKNSHEDRKKMWLANKLIKQGFSDPTVIAVILTESSFRPISFQIGEFAIWLFYYIVDSPKRYELSLGSSQIKYRHWNLCKRERSRMFIAKMIISTFLSKSNYKRCRTHIRRKFGIHNVDLRELTLYYVGSFNHHYYSRLVANYNTAEKSRLRLSKGRVTCD